MKEAANCKRRLRMRRTRLWPGSSFTIMRPARRAYEMLEREELNGISAGLRITQISIFDADGNDLDPDDDETLERVRDEPDLIFCAVRSVLAEVSLTAMPADRDACVRACGTDVETRRASRSGREKLRRDGDLVLVRERMPPRGLIQIHPGTPILR